MSHSSTLFIMMMILVVTLLWSSPLTAATTINPISPLAVNYVHLPLLTWDVSTPKGYRRDYSGDVYYNFASTIPGTTNDETPADILIKPLTEWVIILKSGPFNTGFDGAHINTQYQSEFEIIPDQTTLTQITFKYTGSSDKNLGPSADLTNLISIAIKHDKDAEMIGQKAEFDLTIRIGDHTIPPVDQSTVTMETLPLIFANTSFGLVTTIDYNSNSQKLGQIFTSDDEKSVQDYIDSLPKDEQPSPLPTATPILVSNSSTNSLHLKVTLLEAVIAQFLDQNDPIEELQVIVELGQYHQISNITTTEQPNPVFSRNYFNIATYDTLTLSPSTPTATLIFNTDDVTALKLPSYTIKHAIFRFSFIHPVTLATISTTTSYFIVQPQCIIQPATTLVDYYDMKNWENDNCSLDGARGCDYTTGKCRCRFNYSDPICSTENDVCGTVCSQDGTKLDFCKSRTETADSLRTKLGCICKANYLLDDCSQYLALCPLNPEVCLFGAQIQNPITKECSPFCYCADEWKGTKCDTCELTCQNGGLLGQYNCQQCECSEGFTGTLCQCHSRKGVLTINGDNDVINAFNAWSFEDKETMLQHAYQQTATRVNTVIKQILPDLKYPTPTVDVIDFKPQAQGMVSRLVQYAIGYFSNASVQDSALTQPNFSTQQLPAPTKLTRMNFTFTYGCENNNPDLTEAGLNELWSKLGVELGQDTQVDELFNFDTAAEKTVVGPLIKTPSISGAMSVGGISFSVMVIMILIGISTL